MARKRIIDPGLWHDEGFLELGLPARLLFIALFSLADDSGRGGASTKTLGHLVFAGDGYSDTEIEGFKAEIARNVRCVFYEAEGRPCYQLTKWDKWQKVRFPSPSNIPPMPTSPDSPSPSETLPEDYRNVTETLPEDIGTRGEERRGEESQAGALSARPGLEEREEIFADDSTGSALDGADPSKAKVGPDDDIF